MTDRQISKGQTELTTIVRKLFPNERVVNEFQVGDQMRIDIYCPSFKVGFEYHGIQHYEFIPHFHGVWEDFIRAQARDQRKIELCEEQGISLVAFKYDEPMTEEIVYERAMAAMSKDIKPKQQEPVTHTHKGNPYYEASKERNREYSREMRAKLKEQKKLRGK